jgi:hypothetical protein
MPQNPPEPPRIEQQKQQMDDAIRTAERVVQAAQEQHRYQVSQPDLSAGITRSGFDSQVPEDEDLGYSIR